MRRSFPGARSGARGRRRTRSCGTGGLATFAAFVLVLVVTGASTAGLRADGSRPAPSSPFAAGVDTLLLVGDAGAPAAAEPVLEALAAAAARAPERTLVVFLGDNLYPNGLPPEGAASRAEGERRLAAQADAALGAGARVLFLPGNHDWDGMREDGLAAVRRQERFLVARSPRLLFAPGDGCPGPLLLPTPSGITLAVLDTQWWLQHEGPRPEGAGSPCSAKDAEEAMAQLKTAASAGPLALLTHHPLASGGPHGERTRDWKAHVFPLRDAHPSFWVPIPGLGSAWVAYRGAKGTGQDLASRRYRRLRSDLASALAGRPALFQASGHDHSLQVLEAPVPEARWVLISGSGIFPSGRVVSKLASTRYATSRAGFLRARLERGRAPHLEVLEVTSEGKTEERLSLDLR
ncbi:MAG TPA: metallophosphoesterase [Thermoanaerobaculia bacterium]|nr:metallophosphoesterase [Thermoanaerobaculia bacterium]HQN07925.1 metallophosphoesterase [Thermoanaerobaculia bacterium]HQP87763.1 metallophosphoesterase [Thermoanaerobaculia bacterium]